MTEIIRNHVFSHPSIQPQDIVKLCYQAVFGAEHLLTDKSRVRTYWEREWESVSPIDLPLCEPISAEYSRVNLSAWKFAGFEAEWLWRMFYLTASRPDSSCALRLEDIFNIVTAMAENNELPFSPNEWRVFVTAYQQNGGGPVHHSEQYRTAEKPAYRVIHRRYIDLIPILESIAQMPRKCRETFVIAIDGRAASGKSTLAARLAEILDTDIVHMDDFFLPPSLRTAERLAEPGGNVHYERFAETVISHLKNNESFTYEAFDCSKMALDGERRIKANTWRIVEGSYSHHPRFGHYMDLRVYCDVSPSEQMRRILARNGEQMATMFRDRWIPMEEHYFNACSIKEQADIIYNNET